MLGNIGAGIAKGAVEGIVGSIGKVLDELFTSDEEKSKAQTALLKIQQLPQMKLLDLNMMEAKHPSVFVAGWRPAAGWMCVFSIFYNTVIQPIATWICTMAGVTAPPEINTAALWIVLTGMLGLGGARTAEGMVGVKRSSWGMKAPGS